MQVSDVKIYMNKKMGKVKAYAHVTLDSEFVIRDIKIIEGITIVVKPDFIFPDWILETKYNFSGRYDNYQYQLEAQYRAFNKPVKLGIFSAPFNIEFIDFKPSEQRWELIKKSLLTFHTKVCNLL